MTVIKHKELQNNLFTNFRVHRKKESLSYNKKCSHFKGKNTLLAIKHWTTLQEEAVVSHSEQLLGSFLGATEAHTGPHRKKTELITQAYISCNPPFSESSIH